MPDVPLNYAPQVEARPIGVPYQSARGADVGAFGGGEGLIRAGEQLTRASGQIAEIGLKQQIEDNERQAKDLDTKFREQLRILQFGDGTPENPGYYALRGENALGAYGKTQEQVKKLRQDMLNGVQNKAVRDLVEYSSADQENFVLTNMGRHYTQEREVANDAADEARINEAADEAAAFRGNPDAMARSFATMNGAIQSMAERKGWAPEVIASKQQEAKSVILRKAFDNIILDSAADGEKFFLDNKNQIDAQLWPEFERDIKVQKKAEQAEAEHQDYLNRVAEERARDEAANEYISAAIAGQSVDLKAMAGDKRLKGSDKITIANLVKASIEDDGVATALSQNTTADLFARIGLPLDDPNKISTRADLDQAFIDRKLKRSDYDWLTKRLEENATPEGERLNKMQSDFLSGMKSQITKSNIFLQDPQGDQKYYEFQQYVNQKVIEARDKKEDPYELFRPGSPKYLGTPGTVSQFQRSLKEITQDNLNRLNPAGSRAPAKKTYKSAEDVVKDYNDGKIKYEEAAKILRENGWAE